MKSIYCYLFTCLLLLFSCNNPPNLFEDAIAAWSFGDLNDQVGLNSQLTKEGSVLLANITNDEKTQGNQSDGKAIFLDGSSWLNAKQGTNE